MEEIYEDDIYALFHNIVMQHSEKANWKLILSLISTFVKTKSHLCHMLKCIFFFYIFYSTMLTSLFINILLTCSEIRRHFQSNIVHIGYRKKFLNAKVSFINFSSLLFGNWSLARIQQMVQFI